MKPKFLARLSSLLMSPMYAPAVANDAPKTPANARPTNSQVIDVARPGQQEIHAEREQRERAATGRRPNRSLRFPKTGAMKNCSSAYTAIR